MRLGGWCWLALGMLATYACQGEEFATRPGSQANAGEAGGGASGEAGDVASGDDAGQAGAARGGSDAGGSAGSMAGEPGSTAGEPSSVGGAGGAESNGGFVCEEVGKLYANHCYVPIPGASRSAPDAVAECAHASAMLGKPSYLVSLESKAEQQWFSSAFLEPVKASYDAWLGLGCSEVTYPNLSDCSCSGCSVAELGMKRSHWLWLHGTRSDGWKTVNPNGDGRCAALSWDAVNGIAWVDRVCGEASYVFPSDNLKRSYLSVCEVEL